VLNEMPLEGGEERGEPGEHRRGKHPPQRRPAGAAA
jgi:hypothetical protein